MGSGETKYRSVGKNHEIDQRAIKTFMSWVPDNWLARLQTPDLFVDYFVEIVEAGEPTGRQFGAQIKGVEAAEYEGTCLSYSFKTKHLRYYLNRCLHPVFLFRINTATGKGCWAFAQQYIREHLLGILERQKYATVRFLEGNSLANQDGFKAALAKAEQYVRDLHPGSIEAALQKKKSELEAKDPRFSVSITAQEGGQHIHLKAKETFKVTGTIKTQNVKGVQDFFERGTELQLQMGEFKISGSPLLEDLMQHPKGVLTLQHQWKVPASMRIFTGGQQNPNIIPIEGNMQGGTRFLSFIGSLPESPLALKLELEIAPGPRLIANDFEIRFRLETWVGQHVLLMAHFDEVLSFAKAMVNEEQLRVDILMRGNPLVSGNMAKVDRKPMEEALFILEWLVKCRRIAQHFKINPKFSIEKSIRRDDWEEVEVLNELLAGREITLPAPGLRMTFESTLALPPEETGTSGGTLRIDDHEQPFCILGETVHLKGVQTFYTKIILISQTKLPDDKTAYVFDTTESSTRIVSSGTQSSVPALKLD